MDAKALPGNDSRYVQLKLSLKEIPDILLDHFGAQDKYVLNLLCLASYMHVVLAITSWVEAQCVRLCMVTKSLSAMCQNSAVDC